jgi:putative transposase
VNELFLQDLPGYTPAGYPAGEATLSLAACEEKFLNWLLEGYHRRIHSETQQAPQARWEAQGYLPQMPTSLEQLDLLLLTVAKTRRVQQDGIHFQGQCYMDSTLAAFVKEDVLIRYDPADMGEIHVFYQDRFLCRAICAELSGTKVSLKEIEKARRERRRQVQTELANRSAVVDQYIAVHREPLPPSKPTETEPTPTASHPRLKRYINE